MHAAVLVGAPRTGFVPFFIPDSATIHDILWDHPDGEEQEARAESEERVAGAVRLDDWLREHAPVVELKHHWPSSVVDSAHPIVAEAGREEPLVATKTYALLAAEWCGHK